MTSLLPWSRLRPRASLTPGAGFRGAVDCRYQHAGQFPRSPRLPGRSRLAASAPVRRRPGREEVRGRWKRSPTAAVPGPVCGIDIGKAEMHATIRVPSERTRRGGVGRGALPPRSGGCCAGGLAAGLAGPRRRDGGHVHLLDGAVLPAGGRRPGLRSGRRQAGQEPARRPKRDPSDSSWLAQCFERGAVRPCFVATEEFRIIRLHTRYRRDLINERTREKNRPRSS